MKPSSVYSISQIAKHISARIIGDDTASISGVSSITVAKPGDLTVLKSAAFSRFLPKTKASAVIVTEADAVNCPVTALVVKNPELAFVRALQFLFPTPKSFSGIHPTAIVAKTAVVDPTASIGAHCVIGDNVVIGKNTTLFPHVCVDRDAVIGTDCMIYSHVTLYHAITIGNHVMLHANAVIGADGFGLVNDQGRWEKIPQIGSVVIADDVDIGANTCIDRGALENTVIETGVKIDNLVQIAHNVIVGAHTVIAGCSSIAGSTTVGRHCIIGGSVNIGGHLTICDGVIFTGCAMVTNSVKEPGIYSSGTGLFPNNVWRKVVAKMRRSVRESL